MKILLVEHDRGLLFSLRRYLVINKHKVEEAFDGVIAINNFDDSFDLLIIDGDTPRVPCLEIIKLIKNKKPAIKVIVLMNDSIINDDVLVNNEYVDDFIPRPFSPNDLDTVLNDLNLKKESSKFTNRELIVIDKLKKEGLVTYQEIYETLYSNSATVSTYISAINKKTKGEKIELTEKGFKLVKDDDK